MELLLEHESKQYDYGPSNFSDAVYSDDTKMFESEFVPVINDFIEYIGEMLRQMIFGGQDPDESKAMAALFWCITRYKHLAFREENEVRIVAAPTNQTQEYIDAHRKGGKAIRPLKQVKVRTANGKPIPFIELFGFPDRKLPISKIIVGPSVDKEMIAAAVRKLVIGTKIEVTVSDIPYV